MSTESKETKTTKKVKEMRTRLIPGTALYEIYFEEGGEVPTQLKGRYTTPTEAQKAIKGYLVTRRPRK